MSATAAIDLDTFKVKKAPSTIYYVPDFITKQEEETLLHQVYSAPKPKWTQLSNRKLQNWGGLPHPKGMVPEDLPKWLKIYTEKIQGLGIFDDKTLNHVLVNEYEAGQGIMPHEDGPLFYPTVSTISLGSHTLLDFYYHIDVKDQPDGDTNVSTSLDDRYFVSILLEPRSLIFVCDDMYKSHLHGIAERTVDQITEKVANLDMCKTANIGDNLTRTKRVSLTIRNVPKVLKVKNLFGKR